MPDDPQILLRTRRFYVERIMQATTTGGSLERDIIRHPGAVTIVPMVDGDHVCLIRNLRAAVDETLIELPAGTLEPGEKPAETALRELEEETGYRAGSIESLGSFFLSPGILDERMHLFAATNLTPGQASRQPDEQIENLVVPYEDALEMAYSGVIQDAKTLVGLLMFARTRGKS